MALAVDANYLKTTVAPTLLGTGSRFAGLVSDTVLAEFITEAVAEVQQRLSTRFTPTLFVGWGGPGARPADIPVDPNAVPPIIQATEYEQPHMWPNISPSAGFLEWRMRIRPLLQVVGGNLRLPGANVPGVDLQPDWFRVDHYSGTLTLMPSYGAAALVLPNLPFGLFNWMQQRIPEAVTFTYLAGMTAADWARFPQINRLIGLHAVIKSLPILAAKVNPTGLSSRSADGLSQSYGSGYALKVLDEKLTAEAQAILDQVLDAWDGTHALTIL